MACMYHTAGTECNLPQGKACTYSLLRMREMKSPATASHCGLCDAPNLSEQTHLVTLRPLLQQHQTAPGARLRTAVSFTSLLLSRHFGLSHYHYQFTSVATQARGRMQREQSASLRKSQLSIVPLHLSQTWQAARGTVPLCTEHQCSSNDMQHIPCTPKAVPQKAPQPEK